MYKKEHPLYSHNSKFATNPKFGTLDIVRWILNDNGLIKKWNERKMNETGCSSSNCLFCHLKFKRDEMMRVGKCRACVKYIHKNILMRCKRLPHSVSIQTYPYGHLFAHLLNQSRQNCYIFASILNKITVTMAQTRVEI